MNMEIPAKRLPCLEDLDLEAKLREYISTRGGKVGVLDWLREKDSGIPILPHEVWTDNLDFNRAKRIARAGDILVRSNNPCELLPGSEGMFETVVVYDFDSISDEIIFRKTQELPNCPAEHLKIDWPKQMQDMKFATVTRVRDSVLCNLIEHPNQRGVYWMTFTFKYEEKYTYFADGLENSEPVLPEQEGLVKRMMPQILDIAGKVCSINGFDERYTKQMEFVFDEKGLYLTQAKIFLPKNPVQAKIIEKERAYRVLGVFDFEGFLTSSTRIPTEDSRVLLLPDPKDIILAGEYYAPPTQLVIYGCGDGLLMHNDVPYFLYGQGVAIGDISLRCSGKDIKIETPLERSLFKRLRFKSDGVNFSVKPLD